MLRSRQEAFLDLETALIRWGIPHNDKAWEPLKALSQNPGNLTADQIGDILVLVERVIQTRNRLIKESIGRVINEAIGKAIDEHK